ncbi:MAG: peroxiredoxin [Deltaproteobacteria bacterium]|nr:peroxiredoxin [Deltaproteobacteria bacterium]
MRKHARLLALATFLVLGGSLGLGFALGSAEAADMLKEGDAFPAWKLPDQTGKPVSSGELLGQTYLLWYYPRAMTPGCTAEGQGLRDRAGELDAAGVVILGISFDSPADNAKFAEQESFRFRLLSDDGSLAQKVGAVDSPDQKVAKRISYLVGPDGKVKQAYADVDPIAHAGEVVDDVQSGGGS